MTERIATREDLVGLLSQRQKLRQRFTVTCEDSNGQQLFTFKYPRNRLQVVGSNYSKALVDTFDRCGIVDLKCEYHPSRLTPSQGVKYDSIALPNFDVWFQKTTETKQEIFIDTNMIIHRTLSRALFRRLSDFKEIARKIRILRLVLLELEAKYNRAKENLSKSKESTPASVKNRDPQKQESTRKRPLERQEKDARELGLIISAQIEVQLLKSLGAQTVFSPLRRSCLRHTTFMPAKASLTPS